jgi:hypothetical protein
MILKNDSMEFGVQKKIKSGLVAFQDAENYYIKKESLNF